jgi:dipeptidyl-peptidase-2
MLDYPYPTNFMGNLPAFPVNVACNAVLAAAEKEDDVLVGLAAAAGLLFNNTGSLSCYNTTAEFVECADQTGCGLGPAGMSWDYLCCTETVYYPSTNNVTDMFPPRVWDSSRLEPYCEQRWGVTPRDHWLRSEFGTYGDATLQTHASHLIFSQGVLDPWSAGGVQRNLSDTLIAIMIDGGAHHLDLRAANVADPPAVTAARRQEVAILQQWLKDYRLATPM